MNTLIQKAKALRREATAVALAMRHPRTPWYAKALGAVVVAYALSPIDLIPDFIPVLGILDDLLLVPIGLAVVIRLTPGDVMEECRKRATEGSGLSRAMGLALVIATWVVVLGLASLALFWRRR